MKKILGLAALLISSSLFALSVDVIKVKGLEELSCTGLQDLNKSGYVVSDYQVVSNSLDDIRLNFKVRFFNCAVDKGQFYLEQARIGSLVGKKMINGVTDNRLETTKYFEKIKAVEFYAMKNMDEVLTSGKVKNNEVELSINLYDLLTEDKLIDSINGETQIFKFNISPRVLVQLFDKNKNFIDNRNIMWGDIEVIMSLDMLPPGMSLE